MTMLVLFHTMDPRGAKLGGIETHVRLVLARHPEAVSVLMVGIDEIGDLTLGAIERLRFEQRNIAFLPVAHVPIERINTATKTLGKSTTLRFAMGALRHLPSIRRAIAGQSASCEIERFEFALLPRLLRRPLVLIVHNEGTREDAMDSLLKRYWAVHLANERLALELAAKVFAVNNSIARRIEGLSPRLGRKTEVMSVSVDTDRFRPTPFEDCDDAFHVCFAGRLDAFKDPPSMFTALALFARTLAENPVGRFRRLVFDYVGASDPFAIAEFAAIAPSTIRHGIRSAAEVAAIMRGVHAGIITSFFEGMPCYLLEMLASGRPLAAIDLPQFRPLVVADRSGCLVSRGAMPEATAEALTGALRTIAAAIDEGRLRPDAIADLAQPYSVASQMGRLFDAHAELALGSRPRVGER